MRKNILKKLVAVVATTAMAVCGILANPTEAKAATDKEIYMEVEEDGEYYLGLWDGYSGVTVNAEKNDWVYAFTKVENGVYKISVSTDGDVVLAGLQIYKDGVGDAYEVAKSDAQWSADGGVFNTALQTALNTADTKITISGYDSVAWNFSSVVASTPQTETPTPTPTPETPNADGAGEGAGEGAGADSATPNTGDTSMVALYLAIATLGAVVVLNRKRVNE